jgi:glutathione S-transferase
VIQDPSTGKTVGDTFEIAQYLDEEYPHGPRLIPPSTTALHRAFNIYVDNIFTYGIVVFCAQGLPFNPETAEKSKAEFCPQGGSI